MRVDVRYQDESVEYDVSAERLIGVWDGPKLVETTSRTAREIVREALEAPRDYPPLRQAVVPGDRVAIAFDPRIPEPVDVLYAVWEILAAAGVERNDLLVLATETIALDSIPTGLPFEIHDIQADRSHFSYLAATAEGRRIYLNRALHDADFVLPIGRFDHDPILEYRGPWGLIFPGLSDLETRRAFQKTARERKPRDASNPSRPGLRESVEVGRLLGCQFQMGVFASRDRVVGALAGLDDTIRLEGIRAIERRSTFRVERAAELVVAGVGGSKRAANLEELSQALATANRLVRPGGKIALLSRANGSIGPALRKLAAQDDPRIGPSALRGAETAEDFSVARRFAKGLAAAELYLLSELDQDVLEDLGVISLNRAEDVQRLAASAATCTFLSETESTRAEVAEND